EVERRLGRPAVPTSQNGHHVPTPYDMLQLGRRKTLGPTTQIQNIGEVQGVLTTDEITRDEAGRADDHRDPLEVRLVHECQDAARQLPERLLGDGFLVLASLEVTTPEQRNQVLQATPAELRRESDAKHVGVARIVDVVIDAVEPLQLPEIVRPRELRVDLLDLRHELGSHCAVAEVVD